MKVKIGHLEYKVKICGDKEFGVASDIWGACDNQNCVIYLKDDIPDQYKSEVLLHEIIHAIATYLELKPEEKEVALLAKFLIKFLNENKKLILSFLGES